MKHVPELDGLRGVASMLVVAFHWSPVYVFWGWAAVPLFFVLSGFLMGRILIGDMLAGRLSLREFYIRRALRIWPVYYLSLAAILAYYLLARGMGFFDSPHFDHWLRSLVYLQFTPLYFDRLHAPWAIFDYMPGMQHLWTLAVEEQFYVLLPLLLIGGLPRVGLRRFGWLCAGLVLVGPLTREIGFAPALLLTQIDGLALGVLLAILTIAQERRPDAAHRRLAITGYGVAIVAAFTASLPYLVAGYRQTPGPAELFDNHLLWTHAALIGFGVIGLIVMFPGNRVSAILSTRPLVYAGSVSYALYVFHMPVLAFIKPKIYAVLGPGLGWLAALLTIALLWGLVHASRQFVERPILKLKHRFAKKASGKTTAQVGGVAR